MCPGQWVWELRDHHVNTFDPGECHISCVVFIMSIFQRKVLLTYLCLFSAGNIGHRPRNATVFCPWPSSPFLSWCIPSLLFLFLCLLSLCQVFLGLPLRFFPGGLHVVAWRVMISGGFLNVCPIHHLISFVSFSMDSCLVIFHSVVLDTLTFELIILSLVLVLICFALQIFLNMMNATLVPRYVNLVCLFQWLSVQCSGVVVLYVGFHNLCLASVES